MGKQKKPSTPPPEPTTPTCVQEPEEPAAPRGLTGIDTVRLADNGFHPSKILLDSEINFTGELSENLSKKGKFLALSGYEWTCRRTVSAGAAKSSRTAEKPF
jgi:hypothetical protein